jgi:ABC-type uncharacterized transport system ATPase component
MISYSASTEDSVAVKIQGSFGYSTNTPVLHDIDLEINKGEFVCVIGEFGSGKSSLLAALTGSLLSSAPSENPKVFLNGKVSLVE